MKGGFVSGLGAFTSVGVDVPQTMGSLLSRLQWFDDLDLIGASGEPVTGARVRIQSVANATDRAVGMCRFALAECRRSGHAPRTGHQRIPLLLATAKARDLPCSPEELLGRILDGDQDVERDAQQGVAPPALGEGIDRQASRVFPEGRRGALQALAAAHELVGSGRAQACYVGGVDSLLDPLRLNELLLDRRLLDGAGTDGFVPGEAAVFLKLEARAAAHASCALLGSAVTEGERGAGPAPGTALARAGQVALKDARLEASSLAALVQDGSSEQAIVEEVAMAVTRLPFERSVQLQRWTPAFSVGETGAAAACLSLAMSAFFVREAIFEGPVLVWLLSDGPERGAIVLGSTDHQGGRRG